MKQFACALLGACVYAVDPTATVQMSGADVMQATGSISHKVEGTGATQVLNKNISMAVKMLGDMTNEDKVAVPYSYMCETSDPIDGKSKCYEIRYERELRSDRTSTGVKIVEFSVDSSDAKI